MVRLGVWRWAVWLTLAALAVNPVPAQEAAPAGAPNSGLEYCGQNGLVRFSFAAGDTLVPVLRDAEPQNGVTAVDLWAWLTDVDRVSRDGYALLGIGGFELTLEVVGAEAIILGQDFPDKTFNIGRRLGECIVGLDPGYKLRQGRTLLAHWTIMFQGRPQDVMFKLAPGPTWTCAKTGDCAEQAPLAIYLGTEASSLERSLFGAGCVPAWLNPSGEPDFTPLAGGAGWREMGRCDDP